MSTLLFEAIDRALVHGAVLALVSDRRVPLRPLRTHVVQIDERAPGEEVALGVLHAALDLALGSGPVRPAQPRLEPPVTREALEGRVPDHTAGAVRLAHGAWPIIEMLTRVSLEVLEGALVGVEELRHALVQRRLQIV